MSVAYGGIQKTASQINMRTESVGSIQYYDRVLANPVLNIHVSCKNVVKLDITSPSDPMCVMLVPNNGKYYEIARTEVIYDDPNPRWVKFFQATYIFETHQPLRFEIYDCDSNQSDLSKHDYIGFVDTDVQTLVSNSGKELKFEIKHHSKSNRGTFFINTEQASICNSSLDGSLSCFNLKKMKTFSKNKPYYILEKPSESGKNIPFFRSEVIKGNGKFNPFSIPLQVITNGDLDYPIIVTMMDHKRGKPGVEIGHVSMSINQFMENVGQSIPITDKKGKKTGVIKFTSFQIMKKPTLFDYIRSGLQLNLITAIDFTMSNGEPSLPSSLHFITPGQMNQYESCISSVGSIICNYDTDQQFPVFGFGGMVNSQLSHCFPLNMNSQNPNVLGLNGIMEAYRSAIANVRLSGPTLFTEIIRSATEVARVSFMESHTYTILLIITDGIINDINSTIDAIVDATDAPLSIIIVGVGTADFSAMDILDADDKPLISSHGIRMKRDIVQFVPFLRFARNNNMGLAEEVLAEIPRQVHEFCSTHGFSPKI